MSLYHEAADILSNPGAAGGSLKSRVFGRKNLKSPPNQLYALVLETAKWSPVLKEVIDRSELLRLERKLTPHLALLLVHDLLVSRGGVALPQSHGLRAAIERHKSRLTSEFKLARLRRKMPTFSDLKDQVERDATGEEGLHPRWVRVNALKSNVEDQLKTTFKGYERATSVKDVVMKQGKRVFIDPHVPGLLAITPGIDLSRTDAYSAGEIILQDKASCFPAYLLDPHSEDGDVIDACAAPGNKTTHLAAILHEHKPEVGSPSQTIYAFEKDSRRALILDKMVKIAGSKSVTRIAMGQDFLQVDPTAERYQDVGALLLDPSCSGSGIVGRDSMPDLHLPTSVEKAPKAAPLTGTRGPGDRKRKHEEINHHSEPNMVIRDDDGNEIVAKSERDLDARLEALSGFQLKLLLHALQFPKAKKVTYSTCSIHAQENEHVVMQALRSEIAKARGWQILERKDQVHGMREWPVRGVPDYCDGNKAVAEGCIRSYKDDGQGVMGFFVAGFVRQGSMDHSTDDWQEPYERDDNGVVIRDMLGMPVLKSTGLPLSLEQPGKSSGVDAGDVGSTASSSNDCGNETSDTDNRDDGSGEEWNGFAD
ncbi:hypothetical protein NLU13_3091 [Sarocladium strictum]|uniref:SAM-dependent MTase RsmB/NOP-type domain-containing protein n=1 Tax=Sarocladium strictum TaxID=5046 RepID=A0AA39GM31_SARSR|nr:hypothetical protein NLU13_3091 [Sarocladium strictum]